MFICPKKHTNSLLYLQQDKNSNVFRMIRFFFVIISLFLVSVYSAQTVLQTFSCTGMGYTYIVPNNVCLLKIKAWGAGGGKGGNDAYTGGNGGGGAYAEAVVYVQPGDILTIFTGCGGNAGASGGSAPGGAGGYGLGYGGNGGNSGPSGGSGAGGGGGGSTAVFIGTNVVVVAPGGAGGGGGGCTSAGGYGGGGGNNGGTTSCVSAAGAYGGNFTKDGANGASHTGDGGGAGGGGGGFTNGGSAGSVPPNGPSCNAANDCGASGGGSGNGFAIPSGTYPVVSSFTLGTNSNIPANASDPDLLPGFAAGGTSVNGGNGGSGYVVLIKMNAFPPPQASISYNNPLCEKDTLKFAGSGGATYLWAGPNSFTSNVQNPYIPNVSGTASGTYTLLVQSADGCVSIASKDIAVKPLPPPSVINSPVCETGTLNLVGSGAVSYTWTGPNAFSANTATTSITNVNTTHSGQYFYFAQASNGCIRKDTHNVVVNPNPHGITSATNVSCYGYADGMAQVTPTTGTSPYFYLWNTGQSSQTIGSLPPSTYTVRITDANNCIAFATVTVTEPSPITSTINSTNVDCYNASTGSATINVNGGTSPYSYTWNPGGINSATASNIMAGNYAVIVKDANNCVHTNSVVINQPPSISVAVNYTPVTCWGFSTGIISATVGGGTPPLTYTWLPVNTTSSYVPSLPAGSYTIVVKDNNNCIATNTLFLPEPPPVLVNTSPSATICFGQSVNIYAFANGGNPPYTYSWSNSGFNNTGPYVVNPTVTTIYSVQATDANNCPSLPQTISVNVLPPLAGIANTVTVCDKDTAVLTFTLTSPGNGGPYAYDWHNGVYSPTMMVTGNYTNSPQNFTVTVSDGCTSPDANIVVTLSVHPLPKGYFLTNTKDGCEPLNVQYTAISTSTNDTYQWQFETGLTTNTNPADVVYTTGIYSATLQITNQYGCQTDTMSVKDVTVYPRPVADFTVIPSVINNYEPIATFVNQSVGGTFFQWNFGDPLSNTNVSNEVSPIHYYERDGEYMVALFVMNEFDCRDSAYKNILVKPEFSIYIPNVFTPDGDGLNDTFAVKGIGISKQDFSMQIFNRWGMKIFSSNDIDRPWDGKYNGTICKDGEYVYVIQLKPEYSPKKNDIRIYKGKVFLFNKTRAPDY
ncbi:MAG: hypothetical protein KatS3mg028_1329 [Bacteroidia bacterium]|nr:MAG: hypothetical protein KatS3mg028_1329 [Bacteroidia bacterium]